MEIKVNSWHYRACRQYWDYRPRSLCGYFWKVAWTLFVWYFIIPLAAIAVGLSVLIVLAIPITGWFWDTPLDVRVISAVLWLIIWGIAQYQYRKWLWYEDKLAPREHKEPGLLTSYIEAKHRKICPLVEYTHE